MGFVKGYDGKKRPILAIDYDGVIRQGKRFLSTNERLMPHCKWVIKKLFEKGCRLILWCGRRDLMPVKENLLRHDILQYFEEFNENVAEIRWWKTRKVYADYYIDDLNLGGFPGWIKVYGVVIQDKYFKKWGIK